MLNFNNHIFSRNEKNHAILKFELKSFIDNLSIVIRKTKNISNHQRFKYLKELNTIKQRTFTRLNFKSIFANLLTLMFSFALILILESQYNSLMKI